MVFPALSLVLGVQEDHLTHHHCREAKLTSCPYCQLGLDTVVYWEHLEEHMGANSTNKTSPTKSETTTPTSTPSKKSVLDTSKGAETPNATTLQPKLNNSSQSVDDKKVEHNKDSEAAHIHDVALKKERLDQNQESVEQKESIVVTKEEPAEQKEGPVELKKEPVELKKEPVELKKEPVEQKKEPVEQKKEPVEQEEETVVQKSEPVKLNVELQDQKEEHDAGANISKEPVESSKPAEAVPSSEGPTVDPLPDISEEKAAEEARAREEAELQRKKQEKQEEIVRKLKEIERKIAEKKKEEKAQAMKAKKEAEAAREEVARKEEEARKEQAIKAEQARKEEKARKAFFEEEARKEEQFRKEAEAARKAKALEEEMVRQEELEKKKLIENALLKEKEEKALQEAKSVREAAARKRSPIEVEALLDKEKAKKASSETSPCEQIRARRDSSDRRVSGGGAWDKTVPAAVKPKPVELTEEMERSIIFGSFKKEKKEKKETREEKLQAVKREIESRFKQEEERKRREREEREENERKEREKQRKHEEKLRKEREKVMKERKQAKKKREEEKLSDEEVEEDEEMEEEATTEKMETEDQEASEEEAAAPVEAEPKTAEITNPYQRIKEEIQKMEKEKAEMDRRRQLEQEAEEREELEGEQAGSPCVSQAAAAPAEVRTVRIVSPPPQEEDEDLDDLELMMRDFKETESKVPAVPVAPVKDSLALLRDSYAKKARSRSPSPPKERVVPKGFDSEGHPLSPLVHRAANNAARAIMGPARQGKDKALQCSLCVEENSLSSASYTSAYQLLGHVFLAHRKKIVSRSRKARGMTLACPEGCGFVTKQSSQGVSIDFFNSALPAHLESLCDHIIADHTGEDRMANCHFCELPLVFKEAASWQHLANHRDARRQFCASCKTFPFKNEVHKCPGPAETAQPVKKTLEELAREVEAGVVDPEELAPQKHLGNLGEVQCPLCTRALPRLSSWLRHLRLEHFGTSSGKLVFSLQCFCCAWKPLKAAQMDRENEAMAVEHLAGHLLAEHWAEGWRDLECQGEREELKRLARERERHQEREREEAAIVVPRLPAPCPTCREVCREAAQWRYHSLAHRLGEVFCSSCRKAVLGHQFLEHKAQCSRVRRDVVQVVVERQRGQTWLNVGAAKLKVFYEYDQCSELGTESVTIAKCQVRGSLNMMGVGGSHEEAASRLREEVQDYYVTLKVS